MSIVPFVRDLPEELFHVCCPSSHLLSALGADARIQSAPGDLLHIYATKPRHSNPLSYLVVYTTMERLLDSLASLTNEMTVPALEDAKWWNHLLQANLVKVVKILEERRNVHLCV